MRGVLIAAEQKSRMTFFKGGQKLAQFLGRRGHVTALRHTIGQTGLVGPLRSCKRGTGAHGRQFLQRQINRSFAHSQALIVQPKCRLSEQ